MSPSAATPSFIANTDFGWFSHFLHRDEPPEEVNFWQPSPHGFRAIPPGAPFFFRLGAPRRSVVERLSARRAPRETDYEVGCIMISEPVFFPRDEWIRDHADWRPRIQGGKTIDIARGDGRRVFDECLERTARLRPEAEPLAEELRRHGPPRTVEPRLGQGAFRIAVTGAYGACAVSGEHSLPALEAAHVRPYADGGAHVPNGLLLRADIHRLYDTGYVTVTPDHRFRVSRDLFDDFRRRPRVRALRRPHHHRPACPHRPARPRAARLARQRRVPRLSPDATTRLSSLCGSGPAAGLRRHE